MRIALLEREERSVLGIFECLELYLCRIANVGAMPKDLLLSVQYGLLDAAVYTYYVYMILLRIIFAFYS